MNAHVLHGLVGNGKPSDFIIAANAIALAFSASVR